jgi:hypothetical protein
VAKSTPHGAVIDRIVAMFRPIVAGLDWTAELGSVIDVGVSVPFCGVAGISFLTSFFYFIFLHHF